MIIDYSSVVPLLVDVLGSALPIGVMFLFTDRLVNMFLSFAFPKTFKGGL